MHERTRQRSLSRWLGGVGLGLGEGWGESEQKQEKRDERAETHRAWGQMHIEASHLGS